MRFRQTVRTADEKAAIAKRNAEKKASRKAQAMTCQVCGRAILAHTGTIAHHGYTRPVEGYQSASCHGVKALPFEHSRQALDAEITAAHGWLKLAQEQLKKIQDEKIGVSFLYRARIKNDPYHRTEDVPVLDVTRANWDQKEIEYPDAFRQRRQQMYGREFNFDHVKENAIKQAEKKIDGIKTYIVYQTTRRNEWKGLTHVFDADTKSWVKVA